MRTARARRPRCRCRPRRRCALWTDVARWATFVEGFARVVERRPGVAGRGREAGLGVEPGGPRPGHREGGRARARGRFATLVFEDALAGRQTVPRRRAARTGAQRRAEPRVHARQVRAAERAWRTRSSSAARCATRSRAPLGRFAVEAEEEAGPPLGSRAAATPGGSPLFVFKAAVVGAGTMGGEIAQVIASAGIPVVLKDVKQEFVDLGLEKAREVTQAQLGGLVAKEKITQEEADRQLEEIARPHRRAPLDYDGLRRRRLRDRGRARAHGDQAGGLRRARRGHARATRSSPRTPRRSRSPRWARPRSRPDKVCGFHFFYPASMMRLIEVIEGDETSEETLQAAANFAQPIRKTAIRCGEVPGFVVNRILISAVSEVWRVTEEEGLDDRGGRQGDQGLGHRPDGPVLPHRPARPRHRPARGRAPARVLRRPLLRVLAHEGAGRGGRPRPEDRKGLL